MLGEEALDFFAHPGAYPYPFGSQCAAWLEAATTDQLRRLPLGRLRDQAVSLDEVFAEFRGRYLALTRVREVQGLSPALETEWHRVWQAPPPAPGAGARPGAPRGSAAAPSRRAELAEGSLRDWLVYLNDGRIEATQHCTLEQTFGATDGPV